ncbi:c-type cytochrome [Mucilaginibacter sp. HC2]|uniref:cytochrome-c peroxidase n=1 Tax=Mucilaginibacter inviolabilis TaxID=2714892 RepID=UPI00140A0EA3|nr:cytochrome c peroxidase [Mucilaginibacter inviolabilis]NHA03730.1 c-type cytochrome [Mucilaginibacter inviolabilis]
MKKKSTLLILTVFSLIISLTGFMSGRDEVQSKEQLGEKLFFDPILSLDKTISCSSCHKPEFAFADTVTFSLGIKGNRTARNSPGLTNLSGRPHLFWDGRASSLEEQAMGPITSPTEMGLSLDEAVKRLNDDVVYAAAFQKVFKAPANKDNLLKAIASFERTLETSNSPYDRYINGDDNALSASAARGRLLFIGKANCNNCHSGEDFTADRFKSIGLYNGKDLNDPGRSVITKNKTEDGEFKIPSLRNVAVTAPYMHNGKFKTLRSVVEYYNDPSAVVKDGINRDLSLDKPLNLSSSEIDDIVEFLKALTDDRFKQKIAAN